MRGAKKFKHVSIEPSLCAKYDIMFSNRTVMGEYVWIPSQGLLSDEDNRAAGMRNTTNKETNREEGSGDPEEDAIPYFIHDSNMVGGSNVANSNSNPSSTKRKGSHNTTPQCRKNNRGTGMGAQLFICLDQLVESVSMTRESTTPSRDKKKKRL
jgi:hypothetical protein